MKKESYGHIWGWIKEDGIRCKSICDGGTSVLPKQIIGVWVKMFYSPIQKDFIYHEVFLDEYKALGGTWATRPLSMLLKTGLVQAITTIDFDINKMLFDNDFVNTPTEKAADDKPKFRYLQRYKCTKCGHLSYTKLPAKPTLVAKLLWFVKYSIIDCQACGTKTAKENGIKKKPITYA